MSGVFWLPCAKMFYSALNATEQNGEAWMWVFFKPMVVLNCKHQWNVTSLRMILARGPPLQVLQSPFPPCAHVLCKDKTSKSRQLNSSSWNLQHIDSWRSVGRFRTVDVWICCKVCCWNMVKCKKRECCQMQTDKPTFTQVAMRNTTSVKLI